MNDYDYVIVGSGAGGGPLAANLARAGYRVCLLDAGKRPDPNLANYNVPAFHTSATEDPQLGWFNYVRHYSKGVKAGDGKPLQEKDDKYQYSKTPDPKAPENGDPPASPDMYRYPKWQAKDGVFYPRASALGGCTAHHAMICVYPHNQDWQDIVDLTGDWTWNPENMRRYFEELERCDYRPVLKCLNRWFGWNPTRHGFNGWLPTTVANPKLLFKDGQLLKLLFDSALHAAEGVNPNLLRRLKRTALNLGDFNSWGLVKKNAVGIRQTALSINGVRRTAAREFVEEVERSHPKFLTVKTGVLVEKVLFADKKDERGNWVATGVRYYEGHDLYEASASYDPKVELGDAKELRVNREVILAGGAYSTPQLLMLSGIGDQDYLETVGMPLKVHLPGVGKNLQDRYEVGLVQTMKKDFSLLNGATLSDDPDDPHYADWKKGVRSAYATNGAVITIIKRSKPERPLPDLYIFGLIGPFRGYEPGYSEQIRQTHREFTWVILKAHPEDMDGCVELNKAEPLNPRRLPYINHKNFGDGNLDESRDLESMAEGVKFVRCMTREAGEVIKTERYPGHDRVPTDDVRKIRQWVAENAWGHHASCTCPMGLRSHSEKKNGKPYLSVLDSKFRVFGTTNLRVVDASVFPKIPGFFIVLPLFMASQKAAEQIITDARADERRGADSSAAN
jgi:choline dehydrogenase